MEVTYLEAIKQALDEEMTRDNNVFILGEDVGYYGGAFRVTEGFYEKYGQWRVIDTPLSESGFTGAAIGAALMGMRPVVEMQFADFISCAFDQIVSVAAKNFYRWGGKTPIVIRAPFGGNIHGAAYHSQCPEGWFFNVPGLKIVAPSNPYDAKGLLKASIRDDDPVIYFEHKYLYRRIKDTIPEGEGISLEIIDLRTLLPVDKKGIYESVKKTSKVIILYEAPRTGGVGAEVAALISEEVFEYLDAPVVRISAPDTPVPYSPTERAPYSSMFGAKLLSGTATPLMSRLHKIFCEVF